MMDFDLLEAIKIIAETPTAGETPGAHADEAMDAFIMQARALVAREVAGIVSDWLGGMK